MDQLATPTEAGHVAELRERLIRKRHAIDLMEVSFSEDAAQFAATDAYDDDGFVSPIDWIRFNCHMTSGAAADRVAVGQTMHRMPESIQALAKGAIGFAHLTVMARTADALEDRFDETALVKHARENSPGKFHYHLPPRPACSRPQGLRRRAGGAGPEPAPVAERLVGRLGASERSVRPRRRCRVTYRFGAARAQIRCP